MVNTMFIDVDEDLGNFGRVARDDFFQWRRQLGLIGNSSWTNICRVSGMQVMAG